MIPIGALVVDRITGVGAYTLQARTYVLVRAVQFLTRLTRTRMAEALVHISRGGTGERVRCRLRNGRDLVDGVGLVAVCGWGRAGGMDLGVEFGDLVVAGEDTRRVLERRVSKIDQT